DSASADEEDAHCVDKSEDCSYWSEMGECEGNPAFMLKDCCKSCNEEIVNVDPKYEPVRDKCRNNNEHCSFWALDGGCFDNPKYMNKECAPACQSC
ncbi:predicted protein, partial [Thalassiosira pseudonana CCMP1335]